MVQNKNSVFLLLAANVFVIVLAVYQKWDLLTLTWVYWFQSVIIGIFQAKKMLDLKNFSTTNFTFNGKSVSADEPSKKKVVAFFVFHYGFFHFVYAIFLSAQSQSFFWLPVVISTLIFLVNHAYSYWQHREKESKKLRHIGKMMFFPYLRILPMHLIIMFASFGSLGSLLFFLILKSAADIMMHIIEHEI